MSDEQPPTGCAVTMREVREALGHNVNAPTRRTLPDILRSVADRVDAEDVPQTAEDTADFRDGVRWATAQLRAIAGEEDAAPGDDVGWLPDWLVELAREHAVSLLSDPERAMLRYALELAEEKTLSESDEFTSTEHAAVTSLKRLVGEETEPDYTEGLEYQVVGDWGVDGADSEAEARASVIRALRAHPACGAYAEQRVVRTWPDGSEFYGPWTRLTEEA